MVRARLAKKGNQPSSGPLKAVAKQTPFLLHFSYMAQSLVPSAQFSTHPAPSSTTRLPTDAYVLALAALPGHYAAASSSPSNTIEIYDKASMRHIQSLPGHDTATSSLKSVDAIAGFARQSLISSGHDGSVKVWDDRSNSHSIKSE